jgi:hypothetical protein
MISRNPYHKRRRRRNPGSVMTLANSRRRRATSRRRVYHNPVRRYAHHRRRRNPSDSFLGSLLSIEGLIGISAVIGTPTLMSFTMTSLFPTTTGIYNAAGQAGIGLAAAWLAGKMINKQAGQIVAMVAVGQALASAIADIQAGTPNVLHGNPTIRRLGTRTLGTRTNAQGQLTMTGYIPSSGNNDGNMNGYATLMGARRNSPRMGAAPREPGVYYF